MCVKKLTSRLTLLVEKLKYDIPESFDLVKLEMIIICMLLQLKWMIIKKRHQIPSLKYTVRGLIGEKHIISSHKPKTC